MQFRPCSACPTPSVQPPKESTHVAVPNAQNSGLPGGAPFATTTWQAPQATTPGACKPFLAKQCALRGCRGPSPLGGGTCHPCATVGGQSHTPKHQGEGRPHGSCAANLHTFYWYMPNIDTLFIQVTCQSNPLWIIGRRARTPMFAQGWWPKLPNRSMCSSQII